MVPIERIDGEQADENEDGGEIGGNKIKLAASRDFQTAQPPAAEE